MKRCMYIDWDSTCDQRATWTLNGVLLCDGHVMTAATELRQGQGVARFVLHAYGTPLAVVPMLSESDTWGSDGIHVEVWEPEPVRGRAVAGRKRGR